MILLELSEVSILRVVVGSDALSPKFWLSSMLVFYAKKPLIGSHRELDFFSTSLIQMNQDYMSKYVLLGYVL